MIKQYTFNYDFHDAQASFKVDTEIFTEEKAQAQLDFFLWDTPYNDEGNIIDEALKKMALQAIMFATSNNHNVHGVKSDFKDTEGWIELDGSHGVELIRVDAYEFEDDKLVMTVNES